MLIMSQLAVIAQYLSFSHFDAVAETGDFFR